MADLNPFPDYPVVLLKTEAQAIERQTVVTDAIAKERTIVAGYEQQWLQRKTEKENGLEPDDREKIEPVIVAVRGDYGTGKTHLLLDAAAHIQTALTPAYETTLIRVACLETDPLSWFRLNIGPELRPPDPLSGPTNQVGFIERVMLELYAVAGQVVAGKTNLTKTAVEELEQNPGLIRALIRENLLSVSAVDQQFNELLAALNPNANENIRRALIAAVWGDASALRWLAGGQLNDDERAPLRLPARLSNEAEVAQLLITLAAIHQRLETPFVFIIDELEHLARYDQSRPESHGNLNWLKRLLEGLASQKALVFVSGHWSGWEAQPDYLQRFTQLRPIELVKLRAEDVLKVVRARVPHLGVTAVGSSSSVNDEPFGMIQAEAIAESSGGNIRRVLSLCRVLFRKSNAFRSPLLPQEIKQVAVELGQRISKEDAVVRLHEILERENLTVRAPATTSSGVTFDLVGYQGNKIRIIVDVMHAVHQTDLHDQARVFIDRLQEVHRTESDVIGCFIANGNVDDDLLQILNASRPFKLLWYDLASSDVLRHVADDLRVQLRGSNAQAAPDASAAQLNSLKNQNEELKLRLEEKIKEANAASNAEMVKQLTEQRQVAEKQLAELNQQLAQREAEREEFLRGLRAQIAEADQKRAVEMQELYARLEAQQRESQSRRDDELLRKQEGEEVPKLHATYADLTRPPSFSQKLRLALSASQLLLIAAALISGVTLFFLSDTVSRIAQSDAQFLTIRIGLPIVGVALVGGSLLHVWIRITKIEAYFDYSARILRDVYIRSQSVQDLVRVDSVLRDSLEEFGPLRWRRRAEERLANEFGHLLPDLIY
jgi:hypothetical protein